MRRRPEDLEFNIRVGQMIRQVRHDIGLGQADVAARMDTNQGAISNIETGLHAPTIWLLRRLAHALGCELKITFERKSYEVT